MFKELQFPVSASSTLWGVLYLPDDHDTNAELCPLVIFNHGKGEIGSSKASLASLYSIGPLAFAKAGDKMEFINPVNKKKQRFAIFALQHPSWSPEPSQIAYALENDVLKNYKIDKSCIAITGLSAGGDVTLRSVTNSSMAPLFCAAVPMSPASTGTADIQATKNAGIRTWGFSGNMDGSFTSNLNAWDSKLNAVSPGAARSFIYQGAHGGWNEFYNPAYKATIWGASMNIYEFFLACSKGLNWTPSAPPSNKAKAVISAPTANQLVSTNTTPIDGSKSEGARSDWEAYMWGIKPIQGGSWSVGFKKTDKDGGGTFGPAVRELVGLTDGKYELSLTVMATDKSTNTTVVTFDVKIGAVVPPVDPPVDPPPPPPATKTLTEVSSSIKDGKLTARLTYSDGSTEIKS